MRLRLYHSTWPLVDGASLVNLEQLADSTERLALEIPPLVRENLEGAPETREELIHRRRDGNLSRLGGHSTHLVNWSTIPRMNSLLHGARVPENIEISNGPANPE